MIFCCIDLETTGLDPRKHQILEIGAIVYDSEKDLELDSFHRYVDHGTFSGSAYALSLNSNILEKIHKKGEKEEHCKIDFLNWLYKIKELCFNKQKIIPAGKNYQGFDEQFLKAFLNPEIYSEYFWYSCIDPGSMFLSHESQYIPSLSKCLEEAELNSEVSHTALEDARQTIQVIKFALDRKRLL